MKRILIPTDFSDAARDALEYTLGLFSFENIEYILLNAYKEPHMGSDSLISIRDLLEDESRKRLLEESQAIRNRYAHSIVNLRLLSEYGELEELIGEVVEREEVDVVAMGRHDASGFVRLFAHQHLNRAINYLKCPIIVVPEGIGFKPLNRIALAIDQDTASSLPELELLYDLTRQYQSKLWVIDGRPVDVLSTPLDRFSMPDLPNDFVGRDVKYYHLDDTNWAVGMDAFVDRYEIDMLVVIARHRKQLNCIAHINRPNEWVLKTNVPLLVMSESTAS